MKGVVFTEFLDMVEDKFSPELADTIIEKSDLPNGGSYTSIGTYDVCEMGRLVQNLSTETGAPAPDLMGVFGKHLFSRFAATNPDVFRSDHCCFTFLSEIEGTIHRDVRKLYPDAELPSFEYEFPEQDKMVMVYSSPRGLGKVAEGLIEGCIEHFGEAIDVSAEDLSEGAGSRVRFSLEKRV